MAEPIKPGDLVIQVYDCCPDKSTSKIGVPGTVDAIVHKTTICHYCNSLHGGPLIHLSGEPYWWKTPSTWFKRIPPFEELNDVKREEEITA